MTRHIIMKCFTKPCAHSELSGTTSSYHVVYYSTEDLYLVTRKHPKQAGIILRIIFFCKDVLTPIRFDTTVQNLWCWGTLTCQKQWGAWQWYIIPFNRISHWCSAFSEWTLSRWGSIERLLQLPELTSIDFFFLCGVVMKDTVFAWRPKSFDEIRTLTANESKQFVPTRNECML